MSRLFKRGGVWHGYWRDAKGQKHRESLKTGDRGIAAERLRKREAESPDRPAPGQALGAALTYLLETVYAGRADATVICYSQKAQHLLRLLGEHTPVTELTRADVLGYRAARLKELVPHTERTISPSTVYKELVVLRLALREGGGVEAVVPKQAARYVPRKAYLTTAQAHALRAALAEHRRLWLMLAVYAGLRLSELERLTWDDVDLGTGWIGVRGTKTEGSDRSVPIAHDLRPWLEAVDEKDRAGAVVGEWQDCHRDLAAACLRAAVPAVSANDLRRTFASWLKQRGVDSAVVAKLMGHKSTRMVDLVYGQLDAATLRGAIERMPACAPGVHGTVPNEAVKANLAGSEAISESVGNGDKRRKTAKERAISGAPTVGLEPTTRGLTGPQLRLVSPTGRRR